MALRWDAGAARGGMAAFCGGTAARLPVRAVPGAVSARASRCCCVMRQASSGSSARGMRTSAVNTTGSRRKKAMALFVGMSMALISPNSRWWRSRRISRWLRVNAGAASRARRASGGRNGKNNLDNQQLQQQRLSLLDVLEISRVDRVLVLLGALGALSNLSNPCA